VARARSVTPGSNALGWFTSRSPLVQSAIALSITLAARETLRESGALGR
jgi:hypothetical protein